MISDLNKALRKLRERGPLKHDSGICYNVALLLVGDGNSRWVFKALEHLVAGWPEYSGDMKYPVPAYATNYTGLLISPITPASTYLNCSDMFSQEHEYGRARLRLLDYLIEATDGQ